jgi:hypothetical protein
MRKKRSVEYYFCMTPFFIALLWVTGLNQNGFHPLVAFIPLGGFMPGEIASGFIIVAT